MHATLRSSLLTLAVAGAVVALATVFLREEPEQGRGAGLVLPTPTPHVEGVDDGDLSGPTHIARRATLVAQLDPSPAVLEAPPPPPRLAAAAWMSARNSAFVVTPEQRLAELVQHRKNLAETANGSFLHRQRMLAVASAAAATHLDQYGQGTTSPVEPGPYQWRLSTSGAYYVFERGKYPAYDAAREAWEAIAHAAGAGSPSALAFSAITQIPDATLELLDSFAESAVKLLTSTG